APAYHSIATPAKPKRVALVLAGKPQDWYDIGPPLRGVGTLPVILRSILGIQRAGATRIIVCVHPADASTLRYTLDATDRLPRSVEWLEVAPSAGNLASILGQFAYEAEQESLLVIAADTAYYPGLLRDAMACDGSEAVAFTSGGVPIGIWSLPPAIAARIADQWEQAGGPDDIYPWLTEISSQRLEVQEDRWQPVITLADQVAAERKLNRWLTKPTDGIFAKLNRRISVPISRQLIKWPITPNMVSIFTLGVGFASGVYFAMGGYWNTLLAALLSLWASILDGCDGEVARLKLLESDFGCWLETVCDYLYYLFIFSGMAIGLIRTAGPKFVVWAALLLFGAIATFLVTGFGRHRLARGRPEQYLAIWQGQAEKRRENLILRLGRQTEFMIRRCFLPWAILGFAILGLTNAV
ncbi:MAG TPA: CDP-alcohol phosphatidyltransferase family protein, partial [Candidatus Eisenbacteria bacterium]|nr:CDP-alcohol phosphatidyltransferase family protein [Candidatus Eisenbacteria bacterium]